MQRLNTRAEFQAVLAGPVVARTAHFALHRIADPQPAQGGEAQCRVGAVTPKRLARRAVTRNTIKRQIYTVADTHAGEPVAAWYVVRLRQEFARRLFPSACSEPLRCAARAELLTLWEQVGR